MTTLCIRTATKKTHVRHTHKKKKGSRSTKLPWYMQAGCTIQGGKGEGGRGRVGVQGRPFQLGKVRITCTHIAIFIIIIIIITIGRMA